MTVKNSGRSTTGNVKDADMLADFSDAGANEEDDVEGQQESAARPAADGPQESSREIGGREGPDPTRFGDWEKNGRCIDF